jgi:hypothetical protein
MQNVNQIQKREWLTWFGKIDLILLARFILIYPNPNMLQPLYTI